MTKFVFTKTRRFYWPVKVRVPNEDPRRAGQMSEFKFNALFEAIDTEEAKSIRSEVDQLPPDEQVDRQNDLLRRVVVGWNEDLIDEDKAPIPFSPEVLDELLRDPWVLLAFWIAWGEALSGDNGRRKN